MMDEQSRPASLPARRSAPDLFRPLCPSDAHLVLVPPAFYPRRLYLGYLVSVPPLISPSPTRSRSATGNRSAYVSNATHASAVTVTASA